MNKLTLALASGALALAAPLTPAFATIETAEARSAAAEASSTSSGGTPSRSATPATVNWRRTNGLTSKRISSRRGS